MEQINLEYETKKGLEQSTFDFDTKEIKLSKKGIISTDLTPISNLSNLERFWINGNHLNEIDLGPLSHCNALQILSISDNDLRSIDLTPLRHCPNLSELYIHKNQLDSIDLSPLSEIPGFRSLFLDRNRLRKVFLDPLIECSSLREIRLWKNLLPSLDLTSLFFVKDFKTLHIEEDLILTMDMTLKYVAKQIPTNRFVKDAIDYDRIDWLDYSSLSIRSGWSGVRTRILETLQRIPLQYSSSVNRGLLESFGLNKSSFPETDMKEMILSIPEDIEYGEAYNIIEEKFKYIGN
ncbi:MAG: leucine-rich repeat domain-containing protein [Candidatus Thorarchaeota archaeon]|nr:leucine-rich repeat domain-containing protein [Candidatus Thorarchaeota archaeon]